MTKRKRKINSSEGLAPRHPQTFRSKKMESPSDEISQPEGVQAALNQQDMEEHISTVVGTALQHPQSPLQECAMITYQQNQAARQAFHTKQDVSMEEKYEAETNVYLKNVTVKASEGQEETTVTSPSNDSELEGIRVHTNNETNKSGLEEIIRQENIRSPCQTCTDQLQVFLPTSEEGGGSYATVLEKQLVAKEISHCNSDRNHETSQEEPRNMADVNVITKEAAVGLPAKKKQRRAMCGLTQKERCLQTQKNENGQNGAGVEKQIYNTNTVDLMVQEEMISSLLPFSPLFTPLDHIKEQSEAEIKLDSSDCGGDDRAETEVHIAITTSDGTIAVRDPGCSDGKDSEAEGGTEPAPEKSDIPLEDKVEEHLGNQKRRELEGSATEIMRETSKKQRKDGEDSSTVEDLSHVISFDTLAAQNAKTEKKKDGSKTSSLQVYRVSKTRHDWKEEMMVDASDRVNEGTSFTGLDCGSVELCEAIASPTGSGRKEFCDPEDEPGPSTVNAEHTQTRDTTDLFGSGCLDISDSQLNTIFLIEVAAMEREQEPGSSHCHEDATDLICGLIRELSSLNQKVMATHKELENLRRSSKTSRSSIR